MPDSLQSLRSDDASSRWLPHHSLFAASSLRMGGAQPSLLFLLLLPLLQRKSRSAGYPSTWAELNQQPTVTP